MQSLVPFAIVEFDFHWIVVTTTARPHQLL
jgi:hypothetical protein